MSLPQKTTAEDIAVLAEYLKNQAAWVPLSRVRAAVDPKHAAGLKIEAMRFIGLLERDSDNVKLTEAGRDFARASADARAPIVAARLHAIPLYSATVEWMHYRKQTQPTKIDIANYWHDQHSDKTGGVVGDALTDGAVFFLRVAELAGLGRFVAAGAGRDTHLKANEETLAAFVTGQRVEQPPAGGDGHKAGGTGQTTALVPTTGPAGTTTGASKANVSTDVNINVQIHIAADAKPEVIRDIFKNMRRYVLNQPDVEPEKAESK
jgi:hypothetical protein